MVIRNDGTSLSSLKDRLPRCVRQLHARRPPGPIGRFATVPARQESLQICKRTDLANALG